MFGALKTDLSKAFDCLHHELLIANRKQRVKVGNAYSSWKQIFYGIPQGSIRGPLIFTIFCVSYFVSWKASQ